MKQSIGTATALKIDLASLKWHLLKPNVTKTDLGGQLPEVLIMTMSNEEFEKIRGDKKVAMDHLDDQKIFKRKLIDLVLADVTQNDHGAFWLVIVAHSGKSTGCITAWQVPKRDKD
jgi:hypothetical protein